MAARPPQRLQCVLEREHGFWRALIAAWLDALRRFRARLDEPALHS